MKVVVQVDVRSVKGKFLRLCIKDQKPAFLFDAVSKGVFSSWLRALIIYVIYEEILNGWELLIKGSHSSLLLYFKTDGMFMKIMSPVKGGRQYSMFLQLQIITCVIISHSLSFAFPLQAYTLPPFNSAQSCPSPSPSHSFLCLVSNLHSQIFSHSINLLSSQP